MNLRRVLLALVALLSGVAVFAATYEVTVTRKEKNLYKVDGKQLLIQTKHCYVYAYSEEAFLKSTGYGGGKLIFVDSEETCDVKGVFQKHVPKPGKYAVTVTQDSDDWYEVDGTGMFLQTSMCLNLALGEDAYLNIQSSGSGRLLFEDGDSCSVESVYTKARFD